MNVTDSIFSSPLPRDMDFSEAVKLSLKLSDAVISRSYETVDKDTLITFLCSAMNLMDNDGCIRMYYENGMPSEGRIELIYNPTYAITVLMIYAYQNHNADFNKALLHTRIPHLLNIPYKNGLVGHGYDREITILENMEMFATPHVITFISESGPSLFSSTVKSQLAKYSAKLSKEEKFTPDPFSRAPINARALKIVSAFSNKPHAVFVYGTLRKGERAEHYLQDSNYCGKFHLKNAAMYNLGSYPGIIEQQGESVVGEVYFVDDDTLERMDRYEGNGRLYERKLVPVCRDDETIYAWAYYYLGEVPVTNLMREPWNADGEDTVWYAAYGSNLSEKRFGCYICGGLCEENGKVYRSCCNNTLWKDTMKKTFKGQLYFGNNSLTWGGMGVAFYDENGKNTVQMKLY